MKNNTNINTLLTFYDLPADHWDHLRTGNPIESVFATGQASDGADQGGAVAKDREADGLQARSGRWEDVAPPEGRKPVAFGHRRGHIHRRCRRKRHRKPRRLIRPRHPKSRIAPSSHRQSLAAKPRSLVRAPDRGE